MDNITMWDAYLLKRNNPKIPSKRSASKRNIIVISFLRYKWMHRKGNLEGKKI